MVVERNSSLSKLHSKVGELDVRRIRWSMWRWMIGSFGNWTSYDTAPVFLYITQRFQQEPLAVKVQQFAVSLTTNSPGVVQTSWFCFCYSCLWCNLLAGSGSSKFKQDLRVLPKLSSERCPSCNWMRGCASLFLPSKIVRKYIALEIKNLPKKRTCTIYDYSVHTFVSIKVLILPLSHH